MRPPFTMRTGYSEWCRGEWGEDKAGGGRITRPFLMGMKGTWGLREEDDSSSCQSIKVGVMVSRSWSPVCYSWVQLLPASTFVAVARPADGAVLHSGLSLCFVSSADVTSPVGRFGGGDLPGLGPYCVHGGLFHVLKSHFSWTLKGWNF